MTATRKHPQPVGAVGTFTVDDGTVIDDLLDLEALAVRRWDRGVRAFVQDGAGTGRAVRANRTAHERWGLLGRVLVDVSSVTTATTVLGQPVALPVLIAPSGLHTLVHPDGESATAAGARDAATVMVLSSGTARTIEDVAATGADLWFQLYWGTDRGRVRELVSMAREAGCRALCLTLDMQVRPLLAAPMRAGVAAAGQVTPQYLLPRSAHLSDGAWDHDARLNWADLAWLRGITDLPIVLKGVTSPLDIAPARDAGVAAVVVSNHGGRAMDTPLGTLDLLPGIAAELARGPGPELYVDGGFRHGGEVLVALALGARAVLVGRPALWSLAVAGARGVTGMLGLLQYQLAATMARVGATRVADIGPHTITLARPGAASAPGASRDEGGSA